MKAPEEPVEATNGTFPTQRQQHDADPFFKSTGLLIHGIGIQYPNIQSPQEALERIAVKHYPPSISLSKVLAVNRSTGIDFRSTVVDEHSDLINGPSAPDIACLSDLFLTEGVALSTSACKKAIAEWGGSEKDITHMISTTCTHSANPGYDQYVADRLGLDHNVSKVLLHGVGCSGGLAALRTASTLALGEAYQGRPARMLILACELTSPLVRSELDSISKEQQTRIGACLFSDCASAMVLCNAIDDGVGRPSSAIFELMGSMTRVVPDTKADLGFDVDPLGWKVILSQRIPQLVTGELPDMWKDLMGSLSKGPKPSKDVKPDGDLNGSIADRPVGQGQEPTQPSDFDWALHPGGLTIITGVEKVMGLKPEDLRASYEIYINHGNSSSATVIAVLDRLRTSGPGREYVNACAVGPGISIELMLLKRLQDVEGKEEEHVPINVANALDRKINIESASTDGAILMNGQKEVATGQGNTIQPNHEADGPTLIAEQPAHSNGGLVNGALKANGAAQNPLKRAHCSNEIEEESSRKKGQSLQSLQEAR